MWISNSQSAAPPLSVSGAFVLDGDAQSGYSFSPDSKRLLFRADKNADQVVELFVAAVDASTSPVLVSGTLGADSDVSSAQWSPTGTRVAYLADQAVDGVVELWGADADGTGTPTKLSGPLVMGGNVTHFRYTPSGTRVVFRADKDTDDTFELYIANADGSGSVAKLSGPLVVAGNVTSTFRFTADGNGLVFLADAEQDGKKELYRVDLGTTQRTKLSGMLDASAGDVDALVGFSPDGTKLAFIGDLETLDRQELFVSDADGANRMRVSGALVADGNVQSAQWTPTLPIRPYLPSGAQCAENASCESMACRVGVCD